MKLHLKKLCSYRNDGYFLTNISFSFFHERKIKKKYWEFLHKILTSGQVARVARASHIYKKMCSTYVMTPVFSEG